METGMSDHKRMVLCNRNYVYLNGKWRHKGGGVHMSDFAVHVLGNEDFDGSLERYEAALARHVHHLHLGVELFSYGE
ncbi:MAG: hypothetical protein K0R57_4605 [Paenibacillaceae bacterium]|jgi:hypothetical protein|nr:hypothetical protein [Paenibacillaceae bacterium]